jgi:hypothetical protein
MTWRLALLGGLTTFVCIEAEHFCTQARGVPEMSSRVGTAPREEFLFIFNQRIARSALEAQYVGLVRTVIDCDQEHTEPALPAAACGLRAGYQSKASSYSASTSSCKRTGLRSFVSLAETRWRTSPQGIVLALPESSPAMRRAI